MATAIEVTFSFLFFFRILFFQVMLLHVDNLRRSYEREHTELEETKRVLIEHKLLVVRNFIFFFFFFPSSSTTCPW